MARIRTVKPEFFRHEALQDLEIKHPKQYCMLVYEGLWTQSDANGNFRDRARQLHLDILPFINFDFSKTLTILADAGLIIRYSVRGEPYGNIPKFKKHQRITGKEASEAGYKFPAIENADGEESGSNGEATGKHLGSTWETTGKQPGAQEKEKEKEKEKETIRAGKTFSETDYPDWLDLEAWKEFVLHRKQIKKPMSPLAEKKALNELHKLTNGGPTQAAVIDQSIVGGWQGLFALKAGFKSSQPMDRQHVDTPRPPQPPLESLL